MHSEYEGSDRISESTGEYTEFTLFNHSKDEHRYVGDSATAQQIYQLRLDMEERFADISQRFDHVVSHDRINPTPGCVYCEKVRRAA